MPVIATNVAANTALLYLNNNSASESSDLSHLASGSSIVKASDNAAGLAIGTELQAASTVLTQANTNAAQATSMLQIADGGLSSISNILQRMYALATEAASSNVTNAQRSNDIGSEFTQLATEIGVVISSTTYGAQTLLDGSFSGQSFIVGTQSADQISVSLGSLSSSGGNYTNISTVLSYSAAGSVSVISTQTNAQSLMGTISSAIDQLTQYRAQVGAYESQFNFSSSSIGTNSENTVAATSTIMDADEAQQKSALSSADVLSQAAIAALSQAAKMPQELLSLLQG